MTRLLIVDDDVELTQMLGEYLSQEGFEVDAVHDGWSGARACHEGDYALVVLDSMLPRVDGEEVLRRIRQRERQRDAEHVHQRGALPVLMLTARGDDADRITGLELGADDYVAKPCSPRELTARVRSILRRTQPALPQLTPQTVVRAGALVMWPEQGRAEWGGQPLVLTPTEFKLLEVLASEIGQIVSKDQLSRRAMGREISRFDRSIDVHICAIRHKLGSLPDGTPRIRGIRGMGYQLVRNLH
ncbi:response regulator transcription factor [Ideonella sp. DXS22W]|uniref:Response regulator transcription factor n=1 Tax=Pseudaquabacterium inlustre TaxID=2984192 RepID=A0ABU9CQG6_9BURK